MERQINKKMIARAVGMCIAMGCLPAFAQNFDPPGSHTWSLVKSSNSGVTTDGGRVVGGQTDLLYGRDFLVGGKGSISWTATKAGYIPIAVGAPIYSCSGGSCAISVSYSTSNCTTQQTTYGLTSSTDLASVANITLSYQSVYTHKACSSDSSTATKTVTSVPSGSKALAVLATGYKSGTSTHASNKIFWSPAIKSSTNDQNSTLWTKVHAACVALGWSAPTTHWSSARDVIKKTGFCYLGTSRSLTGKANGAHPFERIATFPTIPQASTRTVGTWYSATSW